MKHSVRKFCALLAGDEHASALDLADWQSVIALGRSSQTLGMLFYRLEARGQWGDVPEVVRWHFSAAADAAEKYRRDALAEVQRFIGVFSGLGLPVILLKGAAYVLADRPFAQGRTFSDLDLLVPRERLAELEGVLQWYGWSGTHQTAYDQRYYREWMHEIPPLVHVKRQTVIDIHHTILPLTAALKPKGELLFAAAAQCEQGFWVLGELDQLLHSATHLFMDSEYDHAFRDLVDFDGLYRAFLANGGEVSALVARAHEHDLVSPLYYALRYAEHFFNTPVAAEGLQACLATWQPTLPLAWMDALFIPALYPPYRPLLTLPATWARKALFIRGHALRMPPALLVRHLFYKAFLAPKASDSHA